MKSIIMAKKYARSVNIFVMKSIIMAKKYARSVNLEIANEVKEARLKKGLSIADVAKNAGVAPGTIWRMEKGEKGCNVESVQRVRIALDITH